MKVTMLGVGNGFSKGVYDNNALVESRGEQALIDCGSSAWWSLDALGHSRESIDAIFITHIHFDHAGGLDAAALYSKHMSRKRLRLIVPAPIRTAIWENFLKASIENKAEGLLTLDDYFDVLSPEEGEEFPLCGNVTARWIKTNHIEGKFSCGILLCGKLFFTSDMICDLPLLERLEDQGAAIFYHDCQLKNAVVHSDFETLKTYPEHIRQKLYLMHHGLREDTPAPDALGMTFLYQHKTMEFPFDGEIPSHTHKEAARQMTQLVQKTMDYIKAKQLGEATGHDWWHTLRVYNMALRLAEGEQGPLDLEVIQLGALLHDIEDWKFNGGDETAGPRAAEALLKNLGAREDLIEHIKEIIVDLSYKGSDTGKMATREGEIVQDADRLDAVGAVGIARTFAFGGAFGNEFFSPEIPARVEITGEEYKDRTAKSTTVNHFYEKLFKLKDLYNTETARQIGLARHNYMKAFMRDLLEECGAVDGQHYRLLDTI